MKKKIFFLFCIVFLGSCEEIPKGYISERILYIKNPLNVDAGVTTYSEPPKLMGSTRPTKFELIEVRNEKGEIDTLLAKPRDLWIWVRAYDNRKDTTLEAVQSLRQLKPNVPTMHVIEGSGQLMFTEATREVLPGKYSLTIKMTNCAGSRVYKDIVSVIINRKNPYTYQNQNHNIAATGSGWIEPGGLNENDTRGVIVQPGVPTVTHNPTGSNLIHLIIRDKNGSPWSWKKGEIVKRGDRPCLEYALPWTKGIFGDVDLTYEYPFAPFPFGAIITPDGVSWKSRYDYRVLNDYVAIDGLTPAKWHVNLVFYFSFNYEGEWTFDITFPNLTRIPKSS